MDDVTAVKMNFRKEQWKQLILERQASGLSINNWCNSTVLKEPPIFTGFVVFGRKPAKQYRIHKLLRQFPLCKLVRKQFQVLYRSL